MHVALFMFIPFVLALWFVLLLSYFFLLVSLSTHNYILNPFNSRFGSNLVDSESKWKKYCRSTRFGSSLIRRPLATHSFSFVLRLIDALKAISSRPGMWLFVRREMNNLLPSDGIPAIFLDSELSNEFNRNNKICNIDMTTWPTFPKYLIHSNSNSMFDTMIHINTRARVRN